MKKSILVLAILSVSLFFVSCKESKKEETKNKMHKSHEKKQKGKEATVAVYQCPMDCEEGKTYSESGSCPVCKMDLKGHKASTEASHNADCKCLEGGECTCEPGKCKCKEQANCTKCEPGKCTCKDKAESADKACTKCEPGKCNCKGKKKKKQKAQKMECTKCESGMCKCKA